MTSKLTINAGIRYDLQIFKNNRYGEESLFVPSVGKVVVFGKSYPAGAQPAFIPDTVLSSNVGLPNSLFGYLGQDTNNVAPRFGFAFQPITNTVVRGAVGLFYNLLPGTYEQSSAFSNLPFTANESYTQPATGAPAFTMNNPFSATGTFSANPSVFAQHRTVTPYTEQFNLAVEHQLRSGLNFRVGYVGQHNVKQNNLNGATLNINSIPLPIVGVTAQSTYLHQPFSTINETGAPIFHSTMNALQVGIHKQYGHGFQLNAEYEWSRILGTTSLENPSGANVNDSYGPIGGTAPQVLAVSYSYELPFGKGKSFFGNAPVFIDKIIRGWQVSGITSISSGGAFSVGYSAPGSPTGLASGRANQVPGVPLYPKHKTLTEWFNPAAFTAPPCYNVLATGLCSSIYTPGGPTTYSTYGTSGNNMLRGPAYQDWDISLEKNTLWRERYRVQLRAESFNIFNNPNFGGPNASINNTANVGTITGTSGEPRTVEFAAKFNF